MLKTKKNSILLIILFILVLFILPASTSNDKTSPIINYLVSSKQSYKLEKMSSTNKKWFQFEDVGRIAAYPSDAFFIPYYKTPVAGGESTFAPAVALYNNKYILAYEKVIDNCSQIYAKTSSSDKIDSFLECEQLLVNNTGFDSIKNPSFVNIGDKTYLAVETIKNNVSKIAIIEYTGQMNIIINQSDLINIKVDYKGFSGQMGRPSLTYDSVQNILRLYFVSNIKNSPVMFYAQSDSSDIKALAYKDALKDLVYGTVFHSAGGYFALFKTYSDDHSCITEWASSSDGINYNRESALVNGNTILNGKILSSGSACAAIDNTGTIKAIFSESWLNDENKSGIMLSLPQMKVSISNSYVTLSRTMALSTDVQVILSERDYNSSDMVRLYTSPNSNTEYEVKQEIKAGLAYQVIPADSDTPIRNSCYKIKNDSLSGLSLIKPAGIEGNCESPNFSPSNLINYDKSLIWQTKSYYSYNPKPENLVVTLPSEYDVGAVAIAGNDGAGFPEAFKVLYSSDNINYKQALAILDFPSISNKDDNVFKFDNIVKAKYIKFEFERFTPNNIFMLQAVLSKIKIYGVG